VPEIPPATRVPPSLQGARPDIVVPDQIKKALAELLNEKHLYQSVHLKWKDIEPLIERNLAIGTSWQEQGHQMLHHNGWSLKHDLSTIGTYALLIGLPVVSTLCRICKKRQPHNPHKDPDGPTSICLGPTQVLCVPLECQGCKKESVVFLVTRQRTPEGVKLQLTGRSIFEHVEVPAYIPKEQEKFYSSAVIAFNSGGQILPALFMLRTLIEQHMRSQTGHQDLRGDDLCDEYAKLLDDSFKAKAPSFKDIYDQLSDALHRADEDQELFESERRKIELHFQGKQAFDEMNELQEKAAEKQRKK
jgi:hypothetical protein